MKGVWYISEFNVLVLLGTGVTLLNDGETDSLILGERDQRLILISEDEDVGSEGGPDGTTGVTDADNLSRSGVGVSGDDDTDTANVATTSGHAKVADGEASEGRRLSGGQIDLDDVIDADIGVRVADGAAIVGTDEGDTSGEETDLLDAAELESSLLGKDSVQDEASLGVVQHTEMLVGAVNVDDVHETGGEGGISADLSVDRDQTLHEDESNLTAGQGVLESVTQKDHQGQALAELVGTSSGTRSLFSRWTNREIRDNWKIHKGVSAPTSNTG